MVRLIAAAGAFVVSLDSMVNIAFPAIAAAFGAPPERMRWIIICYVFTYAVMSFVGGAAADRLGHTSVLLAGLAVSLAGFIVVGVAPTFGGILAGRAVQGFGGGLVYGTAPALATAGAGAAERGRRLGFLGAAIGLGFALGPLPAGMLVEAFGWRAVFHVRVPLMLAALAWALAGPRAPRIAAGRPVLAGRDLLRGPVLRACALNFVANAAIFAIWLLAPFYLITARGLSASVGGALFMLTPLGTALAAPAAGRLADAIGPTVPVLAGLGLEMLGLLLLASADAATPLTLVALALLAAGLGLGAFQVPNQASVMAAFPADRQGAAGGLTFLARTLGVVAGVVVLAEVFAARRAAMGFQPAFGAALRLAAVVLGAALAAELLARMVERAARAYTRAR
jgi:MFS family permease